MAARLLLWCLSPSSTCKVLLCFYDYFNLCNCREWVASWHVLLRITWLFIFDCGSSVVSVRSCLTASWQYGSCPRKKAKCNKNKGRDVYTCGSDTNCHLDCQHEWQASNESSCLQLSSYLHSYKLNFTVNTLLVFSLLQGKSYPMSTVQVQEGILSVARVLLKMEIFTVDQHVPLLWADFSWNAEDLCMVSTVVINKI